MKSWLWSSAYYITTIQLHLFQFQVEMIETQWLFSSGVWSANCGCHQMHQMSNFGGVKIFLRKILVTSENFQKKLLSVTPAYILKKIV